MRLVLDYQRNNAPCPEKPGQGHSCPTASFCHKQESCLGQASACAALPKKKSRPPNAGSRICKRSGKSPTPGGPKARTPGGPKALRNNPRAHPQGAQLQAAVAHGRAGQLLPPGQVQALALRLAAVRRLIARVRASLRRKRRDRTRRLRRTGRPSPKLHAVLLTMPIAPIEFSSLLCADAALSLFRCMLLHESNTSMKQRQREKETWAPGSPHTHKRSCVSSCSALCRAA